MNRASPTSRRAWLGALLALCIAPAALLGPCLSGERAFVPFDLARFPPKAMLLSDAELAAQQEWPENLDVTEIPALVLPEIALAKEELAAGRFPGWNPYARFGAPLFANGLAGLAHPPTTALLLLDDPVRGLAFKAWLAMALAGLLAFALLRDLGRSVPAALLGALAFGVGGTATANAHFYMRLDALIYLPGLLLACRRICLASGGPRARVAPALGLALCTAGTLLAGFPPYAVACLVCAGLWSLALLAGGLRADGSRATLGRALVLGAGVAGGALLSGVQLLPMLAFFPESNREVAQDFASLQVQSFASCGYLGYLLPTAFGEPGALPHYGQSALSALLHDVRYTNQAGAEVLLFPPNFNFTEYTVFVGTLPLLLAGIGAVRGRGRTRFVLLGLAAVFAALAAAPSALRFLAQVPVVGSVPPLRYVAPLALLVPALAAAGLDACMRQHRSRAALGAGIVALAAAAVAAWLAHGSPLGDHGAIVEALRQRYEPQAPGLTADAVRNALGGEPSLRAATERLDAALARAALALGGAGIVLVALGLVRSLRIRLLIAAVATVATVAELFVLAYPHVSGRPLPDDPSDTPIHARLRELDRERAGRGGITVVRVDDVNEIPSALPAGTLFPERIRDLQAYAFVDAWSSAALRDLLGPERMLREFWPRTFPDDATLDRPFLDLCGVDVVLAKTPVEHAGAMLCEPLRGARGETFVVQDRPRALPRAFVVHAVRDRDARGEPFAAEHDLVAALLAADLDPRAAVLAMPAVAAALREAVPAGTLPADSVPRAVRFVEDRPDEVALEVADGPAGLLVLCDAALSGWTAELAGDPPRELPIARGNLFMRVVPVPAGPQRVTFRYTAPRLRAGIAASLLALVGGVLALRWARRRRRPDEPAIAGAPDRRDPDS
ncbi:MAG: hypothetical protein IPM29_16930 [Planctomycetes bacterium]|nr:hypothetical protein [Planctomycetota bacterium]